MIQRVLDEMERTGKPVPGTGPAATVKAKQRDPLMDIADVLGDAKRMTTQEVLQRLAERDEFYRAWTFADLTESLEPHGAAPYKSDGRMSVSAERVREAIANRPDATPEN